MMATIIETPKFRYFFKFHNFISTKNILVNKNKLHIQLEDLFNLIARIKKILHEVAQNQGL